MIIRTVCGYDFFEVSSAMQKAIRRADTGVAGFFALELWASGYRDYVWKRLFTISAEDCYGIITKEIEALWQGHELVKGGYLSVKLLFSFVNVERIVMRIICKTSSMIERILI